MEKQLGQIHMGNSSILNQSRYDFDFGGMNYDQKVDEIKT